VVPETKAVARGDQIARDAHGAPVAPPRLLRVEWNWNAEVSLDGVQRKQLRSLTGRDVSRAEAIRRRKGMTMIEGADALRTLRASTNWQDDETFEEVWKRAGSIGLRRSIEATLGVR
jgi:hypothetical protein